MICDPSLTPSGLWPRAALRSTSGPGLCRDGKGGGGIHKCMAETQSRQMRAAARCTRHMHGTRMHGPLTRGSDIPHAPGSSALMQVRMHGSPPSSQSAGRSGRSCRPGDARARRGLWSRRRRPGRCRPDQRPCGGKRREMRGPDQREGPAAIAASTAHPGNRPRVPTFQGDNMAFRLPGSCPGCRRGFGSAQARGQKAEGTRSGRASTDL